MKLRLTWRDDHGARRELVLGHRSIEIGRDESCDIAIPDSDVSRRHAVIRPEGGRWVFVDQGSTNGSSINGRLATGPVTLETGDRIDIGGVRTLRFQSAEADRRPLWLAAAGVAAVAVIGIAIGSIYFATRPEPPNPAIEEATGLAREGVAAAREGDTEKARQLMRSAAGVLFNSGQLDAVPRGQLQREAMRLLQDHLDVSFDLWSYYENVLSHPTPTVVTTAPTETQSDACRLDEMPPARLEPCLQYWISRVLVEIRQVDEDVPKDFHRRVGRRLKIENDFIRGSLERGAPLIPMLRAELEAARMPPLLHYVALIESGYKNTATSRTAAAGVWQFMPGTGRQYGLRVDGQVDERRDPEKATRAAVKYLKDLAFEFGGDALLLALAGYNRGENGVRRALKKLDDPFSDRSYWRLVEQSLLPEETQDYVPRFIAAAVAGEGGLPSADVLEAAGY